MRVVHGWKGLIEADRGASIALGNFDGVHLGHQSVIALAVQAANELGTPCGVISFDPHPRRIFQPDSPPFRLMTTDQQGRALAALSLVSWWIIFAKWLELRTASRITRSFAHEFAGAHTVDGAAQMARSTNGPPATIMERAMRFIEETTPALSGTAERTARFSGSQVEALRLVLDAETTAERDRLTAAVQELVNVVGV